MKDDRLYLIHIQECLTRIAQYTADGEQAFLADTKTQDAVLRNLQTMAESTQRLSHEVKTRYGDIDWSGIAGFRNVLVHDYLGVRLERVWEIAEREVPRLRSRLEAILKDLQ